MPGSAELKVEAWDYDPMFSDELIGYTTIDLEDRFYDHNWQALKNKPIETRILHHPDIKGPQGSVMMWVELFENMEKGQIKEWDIREPPIVPFQMRLIVWETRDIPMMDVEETSDVYVVGFVDPANRQTTDTHFRCTNGEASFNWRILETINYSPKMKNCHLNIQVYDKDLLSPDEFICSASINLKQFMNQLYDVDLPFKLTKSVFNSMNLPKEARKMFEFEEDEKFWINCTKTDNKGKESNCGGVLCSLEILPMWKAEQVSVGNGRDDPNCNPYLPPPEGRISWSWNPLVLLGQMVGPRLRRKFYCWIICILFSLFAAYFLPGVIEQLITQMVNPYFWMHRK